MKQCETCDHWKPKKDWYWSKIVYKSQTTFYCELTGYRSKDGWKNHECDGFKPIEGQELLE